MQALESAFVVKILKEKMLITFIIIRSQVVESDSIKRGRNED